MTGVEKEFSHLIIYLFLMQTIIYCQNVESFFGLSKSFFLLLFFCTHVLSSCGGCVCLALHHLNVLL